MQRDPELLRLLQDIDKKPWGRGPKDDAHKTKEALNDLYTMCPEGTPSDDVPQGTVNTFKDVESKVYPNTTRTVIIYTPAGFEPTGPPPALAVFQDGVNKFDLGVHRVFDTLIARGEIPNTVVAFVNPGRETKQVEKKVKEQKDQMGLAGWLLTDIGRSWEYDSTTPLYANFLSSEVVPLVESTIGCPVTTNPCQRLLVGGSSGGMCAFNAAWHQPHKWGLVFSTCGSFTNMRGGSKYPDMVRFSPRKPIKVILQTGANDARCLLGNWALANRLMADALDIRGYDHAFVYGNGLHSHKHGLFMMAAALRWLLGSGPKEDLFADPTTNDPLCSSLEQGYCGPYASTPRKEQEAKE